MGKKITQYPASAGNPDVTSLIDISEFDGSIYTSKKLTITQLIDFLNTNLNLGSSFTFKNNTGDTISKGMAVELSGASGLDLPEIALLSSSFSDVGLSQIFIANEDILNGNSGNFIQNGFLDNWYTIGLTVGQKIFWDVPSQSLTVVGTDIDQVFVGIVTVVDANGQLFVSPTRGTRTLTSQLVNDGSDTINPFITALDVPAVPTLTSELTNDGADTINPFITALDIPAVPTLTSELTNDGEDGLNPFITALDIPTFASADKMVTVGRNSTGSTLYKGTIVYILGSTGNRPNFVKARADVEATSAGTFGVIENNILNNADGNCVTIGAIDNLDTRSTATHPFTVDTLVDGDTIYLSPTTAGYITNVKPTAPDHLVYMGKVVETSPTNGTIVYRIQNGYELQELHNVAISSVTNNDILQYETSTSLWKNKAIPTASGSVNGYLSSTDWTTFNNKVATTRTLTINGTAQDLSADRSWTIASSAIPQANKIYVDSINGVNLTGRGNINNPYLTPEYALSDITNTGTVTATTTNLSATLTAVSSTANIVIGQFITGTGIPYGSTVVSKTVNTIVLSQACTAGATITATWWTPYLIMLNGDFVATGNWQKQGFTFNCLNSTISWGAFNLFTLSTSQLVPFSVIGGNWNGTSASSRFLYNSTSSGSSADFIFKPFYFYSIGTGYSIDLQQNGVYKFNNFALECPNYICAFGSIANFESNGTITVSGYFYSLLQGFLIRYCTFNVFGKIQSPSSVNIINNTQGATIISNAIIVGSMALAYGVFNGNIFGTTLTNSGGGTGAVPSTYNGSIQVTTFTNSGHVIINGQMRGNVVNNGALGNIVINEMMGIYTGSSSSKGTIRGASDVGNTFSATLSGTAELIVLDTRYMINAVSGYTIGVGCTLYNKGYFRGGIGTMAGTLINEGNMTIQDISTITGTFKNFAYINLARGAAESAVNTPTIAVSTGTLILNAGSQLECQLADSKSGLIRKTASGGKVVILGQPYFKVANGLAPLQILSNTGTAQDVLNFGLVDNCAVGFRLANTFTDTTYGVAYTPNILGGGTNYEDTTYSF